MRINPNTLGQKLVAQALYTEGYRHARDSISRRRESSNAGNGLDSALQLTKCLHIHFLIDLQDCSMKVGRTDRSADIFQKTKSKLSNTKQLPQHC